MKKIILIGLLGFWVPLSCFAGNVSGRSIIKGIYTYGEDSGYNNQIIVQTNTEIPGCEAGFWVESSDSLQNKKIISLLLSAFHTETTVYFAAYDHQRWVGSSAHYCKLHTVGIEK